MDSKCRSEGHGPIEGDAEGRAIYDALKRLREQRTKLTPDQYHAAMSDDDWIELGMFLVGVVSLDETVAAILTEHTDHSAGEVGDATFGKRLRWAKALLKANGVTSEELDFLFQLNALRIAVVHRLPSFVGADEDRKVWSYSYGGDTTEVEDLMVYSFGAWKLFVRLSSIDFAVSPGSSSA